MLRSYSVLISAFILIEPLATMCPRLCHSCECLEGDRVHSRNNIPFDMFIGIPYAEPPIGVLRFKNPVPYLRKNRRPLGEQSECLQRDIFLWNLRTRGDEDCLYLNVYRPDARPTERLPVLVYFPHSNLLYGSGHVRDVAPDTLMEQDRIVLVVAQFRVGLFGFFTTGDRNAPGNLGLKDQQVALKWVYKYIAYFSGDPHDVTVYGDGSVQYQILPKKIHFRRAIISGSYMFSYNYGVGAMNSSEAAKLAGKFSKLMFGHELNPKLLVERLQDSHPLQIMQIHNHVQGGFFYPFNTFGPIIETDVVERPNRTFSPPDDDVERRPIAELTAERALKSLYYPNFLVGDPEVLWKTHEHDIPVMFGYSNYYGEQLVETVENFTQYTLPMTTIEALMLHLNLTNRYRSYTVLWHYLMEDKPVFSITYPDRKRYVNLFNDYFYYLPLVKSIIGYTENIFTAQNLYLFAINEGTDYNNVDAQHLFPPSYEVVYQSSLVVITMFEEFINTGEGPLEACIISNEHPSGALCPYSFIQLNQYGIEEKVYKDVFDESNVDFWNQISPLKE